MKKLLERIGRCGVVAELGNHSVQPNGFVNLLHIGEHPEAFQGRRRAKAPVESDEGGAFGIALAPGKSCCELQGVSGPQWVFGEKLFRRETDVFVRSNFERSLTNIAEDSPCTM
jgi:hypothetical protein